MLTRRQLAVARAALQYFSEEVGPHGAVALQPYLKETWMGDATTEDVNQVREVLQRCTLRYVCCDRAGTRLILPELFPTFEAAQLSTSHLHAGTVIATVVVPAADT